MSNKIFNIKDLQAKPVSTKPTKIIIRINESNNTFEAISDNDDEETEKEKEINKSEKKTLLISDRRKYHNIERNLIFDKISKNNAISVPVIQEYYKPVDKHGKEVIEPIGKPEIIKKTDKQVVIQEEPMLEKETEIISEETKKPMLQIDTDKNIEIDDIDEITDLKEILSKTEKPLKELKPKQVVIIEPVKKPRKLKIKAIEKLPEDSIQIDLATSTINDTLVAPRLPKETEKVIIKAPTYYMNNRKIFVQKLNQLFQPYKSQIDSNKVSITCDKRGADSDFELLTHQEIVRDYLNLYTPYRGLLLYHGLGSGKTCTSIAIAEGMKTDKKIFVLTPASLKMNFFSEIKKCGDHLYKKNQYWEFVSIEGKPEYTNILSKALSLPKEYVIKKNGAWLVNVEKSSNFAEKTPDEQTDIDEQLNLMIRAKYVDINYNGINMRGLKRLAGDDLTTNPFDNSVVIIDEAHNLVSRIVNKVNQKKSLAYLLYDFLMSAQNAKVVLLTGTPIINYPNEIGILYNILRGYIKSWTITTKEKPVGIANTDDILQVFDKSNLKTYDFVEYSGDKLVITRNPFGFTNLKKRGALATKAKGGSTNLLDKIFGGKSKKKQDKPKSKRVTKKNNPESGIAEKLSYEEEEIDEEYAQNSYIDPHLGGGGEIFEKYNGVHVDEAGNISDDVFQEKVVAALKKGNINVSSTTVTQYKALPDDKESFLKIFVDADNGEMTNMDLFKRRILGLTSYFRSAQEKLLPSFVKTDNGDIFHVVKCEMTPHQFGVYEKIRKLEAEQEKRNKKNQKKGKANADELFKISSTYRIFSRSACNFAFPAAIERPMPEKKNLEEIDEDEFNVVPLAVRKTLANYIDDDAEEGEEKESEEEPAEIVSYGKRIEKALEQLQYNPDEPRETEYLKKESLGMYSPKFVKLLDNLMAPENIGLHLVYSQFRTIEGIGILKLILEANGFAEFKIKKDNDGTWFIDEKPADKGKPRFVLYTGTETAEEKEIVRNIYNSSWELVPSNITTVLKAQSENSFMGEVIKIFMITSSGAEGINLKNTRFVHIVEPYWHMVRIEQVIGRARRICSHQDLPEELRTVQIFLYLATLSEEQRTSEDNIELRIRDISRLDNQTPVTTDESLFEIASIKDNINKQILKSVKESAIDCSLYSNKNKDEPLVCYGFGKISSNEFGSYPAFETDRSEKADLNIRKVGWIPRKVTIDKIDYALNENTMEVYDFASYDNAVKTGADMLLIGKLEKEGNKYVLVKV